MDYWQDLVRNLVANPTFWTAMGGVMGTLVTGFFALRTSGRTARATDNDAIRQDFKVFAEEMRADRTAERAAWEAERQEYKAERKELHNKVDWLTEKVDTLRAKVNTLLDHVMTLERFIKSEGGTPPKRPDGIS